MKNNPSIRCTVQQCKYHSCDNDYCTLQTIEIGTHEINPTKVQCTDCNSFALNK